MQNGHELIQGTTSRELAGQYRAIPVALLAASRPNTLIGWLAGAREHQGLGYLGHERTQIKRQNQTKVAGQSQTSEPIAQALSCVSMEDRPGAVRYGARR